jgi:hypothetical protein
MTLRPRYPEKRNKIRAPNINEGMGHNDSMMAAESEKDSKSKSRKCHTKSSNRVMWVSDGPCLVLTLGANQLL